MKHLIGYTSGVTGLEMWIRSVGEDPEPRDEFGRSVQGCRLPKNAKTFTLEEATALLPKVREVHPNAAIVPEI